MQLLDPNADSDDHDDEINHFATEDEEEEEQEEEEEEAEEGGGVEEGGGNNKEEAVNLVDQCDEDGDGVLDAEEVSHMLAWMQAGHR